MRARFWRISSSSGLLLLAALALSLSLQLELPRPTGPHIVGQTTFRWVDSSRREVLTDDPVDSREVIAMIWYPAVPGTGRQDGYFPSLSNVSQALRESGEMEAWEVFGLQFIRSHSYRDAEPVKDQGPFSVVLLSPGNGTNVELYSGLAGELASHGYIVVGINHPYDVAAAELSNGSVAPYNKTQWSLSMSTHHAYTAERIKVRVADVRFALDQLETMNADAHSPFAGLLDLNRAAVAGHSLGGITASEACKADARFKACLNFDGLQNGGPFSTDAAATPPEQPFMFLTKESQLHPRLIERFESTSESYWVLIRGASHESFTDGPQLQPSLLPGPNQADHVMTFIEKYTLAFLEHALQGKSATLLTNNGDQRDVSVKVFPSR